jgi:hypothetical protein
MSTTMPGNPLGIYVEMTDKGARENLIRSLSDIIEDTQAALRVAEMGGIPTSIQAIAGLVAEAQRSIAILETINAVSAFVPAQETGRIQPVAKLPPGVRVSDD